MLLILYFVDDGLLDHDEFENAPFDFRGKSMSAYNCFYNSVRVCAKVPGALYTCIFRSFPPNLTGKRELVALLSLSSWCLVILTYFF